MPLIQTFNFEISLRRAADASAGTSVREMPTANRDGGTALADGAFQECSGLEVEMDVQEYLEGGRNDGVIRRVGRAKYSNIVLKRGMFHAENQTINRDLWTWLQSVLSGQRPVPRYNGFIDVMNPSREVVATWFFERGLPAKVTGPQLEAKTGDIAIEELHIAHEGLQLWGG